MQKNFINSINILKIALILVGLAIPYPWYLLKWEALTTTTVAFVYVVVFVICTVATIGAAFCINKFLRIFYAILFTASVVAVDTYQIVMDEFFFYSAFIQMYEAIQFAGSAIEQFGSHAYQPIIAAGFIGLGILIPPSLAHSNHTIKNVFIAASPVIATFVLALAVLARGGTSATGMPGTLITAAYGTALATEQLLNRRGEREPVILSSNGDATNSDIILLVDESVRGNYLDIGGGIVSSGLLESQEKTKSGVYNFGIAASAVNCSNGSNLILRYGGTREHYQEHINKKPSLWAYAKSAGYRTIYLDAQETSGRMHNEMTIAEATLIDNFIQYENVPPLNRDQAITEDISKFTHNDIPELIYVNKIGAHFPVHDKYPDEFMHYRPVAKRGSYTQISDAKVDELGIGEWETYTNAYRNTLLWNVGNFFEKILENANLDNSIIVYTSDHGQNFHEDGSAGFGLHCSNSPSVDEGIVPMVLITKIPQVEKLAKLGSIQNFDNTSHYNIFPTLLSLMNYDHTEINTTYGNTLFEKTNDPLTFNSRFRSMIGTEPKWVSIKPSSNHQFANTD